MIKYDSWIIGQIAKQAKIFFQGKTIHLLAFHVIKFN